MSKIYTLPVGASNWFDVASSPMGDEQRFESTEVAGEAVESQWDQNNVSGEPAIPWEEVDAIGDGGIDAAVFVEPLPGEEVDVESLKWTVEVHPEEEIQQEQPATEQPTPTTSTAPTETQIRNRKLELCDMIERAEIAIAEIEEEIAGLSTSLKAAKKAREDKVERLRDLAREMRHVKRSLTADNDRPLLASIADAETDQPSLPDGNTSTAPYNPWDHIDLDDNPPRLIRVLVDVPPATAGQSLQVFDVEPAGEDGDSLSGQVIAKFPNSMETVTLQKCECWPVREGIREAVIGERIVRGDVAAAAGRVQPEGRVAEDLSWRTTPVSVLDLPPSLIEILIEENSIRTIGQIADWTQRNQLVDLKKVGAAKAEKIEAALEKFWKTR